MKQAYVSEKFGIVTLSIIRDNRPSMQISIDMGFTPVFAINLPFPEDEIHNSDIIFNQGIGILLEQIHLFLNDRGFPEDDITAIISTIIGSMDEYREEEGSEKAVAERASDIDEGGQVQFHEIYFPLASSFTKQVQDHIISNKTASEYINRAVEFEKRLKERDQNQRAKEDAAEIINRYKGTIKKTVPGPLYVTLYDRFGKPSGVARVTNQGVTKWADEKKSAMKKISYVVHMPGHKNSKGEAAPWVIKSHETGKILSSHKSQAEAKKHLQEMHIFKNSLFNHDTFNFSNDYKTNTGKIPSSNPSLFPEDDDNIPFLESPKTKIKAAVEYDIDTGPGTKRDISFNIKGKLGPNFKIYVNPVPDGGLEGEVWVEFEGEELNRGYPPFKPSAKFKETPLKTAQNFAFELKNIIDQEYDELIYDAKAKNDKNRMGSLKAEANLKYQEVLADIMKKFVPQPPPRKWSKLLNVKQSLLSPSFIKDQL